MRVIPEDRWNAVAEAAGEAARRLQLPATWLNRDCAIYAWCMPLGWESRCKTIGRFGPMEVVRAGRADLIAAKVVSTPKRPQDLEDLIDLDPTESEFSFVLDHLDRLEAESLDRESFDDRRAIVNSLRHRKRGRA